MFAEILPSGRDELDSRSDCFEKRVSKTGARSRRGFGCVEVRSIKCWRLFYVGEIPHKLVTSVSMSR